MLDGQIAVFTALASEGKEISSIYQFVAVLDNFIVATAMFAEELTFLAEFFIFAAFGGHFHDAGTGTVQSGPFQPFKFVRPLYGPAGLRQRPVHAPYGFDLINIADDDRLPGKGKCPGCDFR